MPAISFPTACICLVRIYPFVLDIPLTRTGIVTLLFCGITLKHYAYYNMSRQTQLTTKWLFQVLAQLSENFIFIYLGLSLFTDSNMQFNPLFIIITIIGICAARWCAVFPLSRAINWFIRYRAKRRGKDVADELPYSYQAMLFWAGLRGAVGVALAAGITGKNAWTLKATVLVVVVLTVIIFGGTTARMLEILGIKTGVVEEIDSDDEFDIEAIPGGSYYKHSGTGIGNIPRRGNGSVPLNGLNPNVRGSERGTYVSGNSSPANRPSSLSRKQSSAGNGRRDESEQDLLQTSLGTESDVESDTSDLPPAAKRSPNPRPLNLNDGDLGNSPYPTSGSARDTETPQITASGAISQLLHGTAEDHAAWFKQLDEGFIKPKLLLDGGKNGHGGPSGS
jgi:solute carrier family 9 (sodium/hydrogen exchanger), member 6/7